MLHNELIAEYPCMGELIRLDEKSTPILRVLRCVSCGAEFTYVPDSNWVTIALPGARIVD
jgi:hypothetical protein